MRLVVLAGHGPPTNILINYLQQQGFSDLQVILEEPVPRQRMIRNRIRRLGLLKVLFQLVFQVGVVPVLNRRAGQRSAAIMNSFGLSDAAPADATIHRVASVNAASSIALLQGLEPDMVVVNGTRIISARVLDAVGAPFVNTHVGITPAYRGVHGGYWALWNRDVENFGATLHLVDPGVDTGDVLHHVRCQPEPSDTFATYPLLQQAHTLPLMVDLIRQRAEGRPWPRADAPLSPSQQWYHPTIWQYLAGRLRGVK